MTHLRADQIDDIVAGLGDDGLYVDPTMEGLFSAAEISEIQAAIGDSDLAIYVVVIPLDDGDLYGGSGDDLLARVHDQLGEPGLFIAPEREPYDESGYFPVSIRSYSSGEGSGDTVYEVSSAVNFSEPASLPDGVLLAIELSGASPAELREINDAGREARADEFDDEQPEAGGVGGALLAVVIIAAVVIGALGVALKRAERQRRPATLPRSAMSRIRAAHDRELERQAEDDVLALGEAIEAAEVGSGSAAARSLQAALDHYDAARRITSRMREPDADLLDTIGAIVLADRGQQALRAASGGSEFSPTRRCFLNPLHGRATTRRAVSWSGAKVKAPVCGECRTQLSKPSATGELTGQGLDILDVVRRGSPVHYFETDAEPWSSTGFGSLELDLITLLHRDAGRD